MSRASRTCSAGANAITLDGVGKTTNFGSVQFAGGSVTIQEDSALIVGGASGSSAASLSLTAGGSITQTQPLTVSGTSSFAAGANAITLGNGANDFTGAVSLSNSGANNVSRHGRRMPSCWARSASAAARSMCVAAVGITQTGAVVQAAGAGAVTLNGGTGSIALTLPGNDFTGAVSAIVAGAGTINIADGSGGLNIAAATTANGTITLNATGGNLTLAGVNAGGAGDVVAGTTTRRLDVLVSDARGAWPHHHRHERGRNQR